jgi:two-component system, OmpR family, sensor kinase
MSNNLLPHVNRSFPARGSLAWRLYAVGLVQLVLLAIAVLLVGHLLNAESGPPPPHAFYDSIAGDTGSPPAFDAGRVKRPGPRHEAFKAGEHRQLGPSRRGEPPGPWAPLLTFFLSGLLIVGGGAVLTWRWMARPLAQLAHTAQALGNGDLSARAKLTRRDEIGALGRGLDEMASQLESLVQAQKELLANVSHELRTPLARIRVALDIADEGDAAVTRSSLREIAVDLAELETILEDILTTARMELQSGVHSQAFPLRFASINPNQLFEQAVQRFQARFPERPLELSIEGELPQIYADAALFRRVLGNLLDNAHKYTPDREAHIEFKVLRQDAHIVFEVLDSGIGIAEPDLPRVFEPFFRAERSRARGTGGIGLGLTLARRIVSAHGGEIILTDRLPEGTRALVRVPVAQE